MSTGARYGVNIGMGAASGAAAGTAAFPGIGTAIGAGLGALGGGLSTLLQTSDEAKKRKAARDALLQQRLEASQKDWANRVAAISGISNNPMYLAMTYKPYDPKEAGQEVDKQLDNAMPEPEPNYGGLVSSLGQLGGTVGAMSRQSALQDQLDALQQSQRNGFFQKQGSPWGGYSSGGGSWY